MRLSCENGCKVKMIPTHITTIVAAYVVVAVKCAWRFVAKQFPEFCSVVIEGIGVPETFQLLFIASPVRVEWSRQRIFCHCHIDFSPLCHHDGTDKVLND